MELLSGTSALIQERALSLPPARTQKSASWRRVLTRATLPAWSQPPASRTVNSPCPFCTQSVASCDGSLNRQAQSSWGQRGAPLRLQRVGDKPGHEGPSAQAVRLGLWDGESGPIWDWNTAGHRGDPACGRGHWSLRRTKHLANRGGLHTGDGDPCFHYCGCHTTPQRPRAECPVLD